MLHNQLTSNSFRGHQTRKHIVLRKKRRRNIMNKQSLCPESKNIFTLSPFGIKVLLIKRNYWLGFHRDDVTRALPLPHRSISGTLKINLFLQVRQTLINDKDLSGFTIGFL